MLSRPNDAFRGTVGCSMCRCSGSVKVCVWECSVTYDLHADQNPEAIIIRQVTYTQVNQDNIYKKIPAQVMA